MARDPLMLRSLLDQHKVVVCCGPGGVGKTTTSAGLGVLGARQGKRVLVLTIDPARRLADAMGISAHSEAPVTVSAEAAAALELGQGKLDIWMLDPSVVFVSMVNRLSSTPAQAAAILEHRLFKALTELMAGMQEYTAAESLHQFVESGQYDLVVLDTPPSRNALAFLEAPSNLSKFLDERVLDFFLGGTKSGFFRRASELVSTVFQKVFGADFVLDLQSFLKALSSLLRPMSAHAQGVRRLLLSQESAFVLVTTPEPGAIAEARYFEGKLRSLGISPVGWFLNKSSAAQGEVLGSDALSPAQLEAHPELQTLSDRQNRRIEKDQTTAGELEEQAQPAWVLAVPEMTDQADPLAALGAWTQRWSAP